MNQRGLTATAFVEQQQLFQSRFPALWALPGHDGRLVTSRAICVHPPHLRHPRPKSSLLLIRVCPIRCFRGIRVPKRL